MFTEHRMNAGHLLVHLRRRAFMRPSGWYELVQFAPGRWMSEGPKKKRLQPSAAAPRPRATAGRRGQVHETRSRRRRMRRSSVWGSGRRPFTLRSRSSSVAPPRPYGEDGSRRTLGCGELDDTVELRVAADDAAGARAARRFAAGVIDQWAMRPGVGDEACLVVSELVTNASTHGRSDAVLRLLYRDGVLRVEVLDEDTRLPVIVAPDFNSLSGRGLTLVAALATLWGADRTADGKVVWAEFDVCDRRTP